LALSNNKRATHLIWWSPFVVIQSKNKLFHCPQLSVPWHELEQVRFDAFHPVFAVSTFFTPLLWVAALTDVAL